MKHLKLFLYWITGQRGRDFRATVPLILKRGKYRCSHEEEHMLEFSQPFQVGDWGPYLPHPNPKFSAKIEISERQVYYFCRCKGCGALEVRIGHDQRVKNAP